MEGNLFYQAFVYLSAAVVAVPLAKKLGLGSVLGYLIAGILIGPYVLELVGEEGQDVMHFAEFGVVMMLFLVGLELQPSILWKLRAPILGLGGLQVLVTAAVVAAIVIVSTSLEWQIAVAIGLTLALSSTAIVLQTLNEKGLMKTEGGQNAFSVLLMQDIAVIPILAFFPLLATQEIDQSAGGHESHNFIESYPIWAQTLIICAVIASIILAGRYLLSYIFRLIAETKLRELFTAASLLLVIGITLLMTSVGLSPALGTFVAGVVLAQSEYRHELETDIEPFKGLLLGLFFIAVGASIDFNLIYEHPALITEIVLGLIIVKLAILVIIGKIFGMKQDNNLMFAFSLAQGGEFAFVLLSYALQNGVMTKEVSDPLIASVAISMALTPLLMLFNEKLIQPRFGTKEKTKRKQDEVEENNSVIIAGFGRYGSIIGRFLQANGIQATYLDLDPNNVDRLRKFGLKVFYGDASRHDLLHAAKADEAKLLIVAVDKPDKSLEIIETAEKHFPHLKIMVRTQNWSDHYEMLEKDLFGVYREFSDTALRMGADALGFMGHRKYQVQRSLKKFRKHDENFLRELAKSRHEEKNLLQHGKRGMESIEVLMLEDMTKESLSKDFGWESNSIKQDDLFKNLEK
ncbi:monovalent cation:proton antiporter-2 (CPA2) family protein [Sediminitomix flava]|uniref:Kef-type potassium/proton antiporter (CPA2 family) n=1 Tax=Sediminitomix flava TaxID=379075 RepID=A0A315Z5E7_SEDFL|nr:monovalent cation:proton antiporter-2 (CPA2) family protein [Sediminitomix flava]PWJ37982.1 Kef-type potassium/proton antiporter (CPA2 family) [Sediminitomix flava]